MWTPANLESIPSPEEKKLAKGSILELELQLEAAVAALRQAQNLVHCLEAELAGRKAWVAPIRRIPLDILSLVFIEASKDVWMAPLTLEQVCRGWHAHLLGTPRAWSYIHVTKESSPPLVAKYLSHCRHSPLHITVTKETNPYSSLRRVSGHASRISAIEIDKVRIPCTTWDLSNLRSLHIRGNVSADVLFGWLGPTCKSLRCLNIHPVYFRDRDRPSITQSFAHLQHLVISDADDGSWIMIVDECAYNLVRLDVTLFKVTQANNRPLRLPRLMSLEIEFYSKYRGEAWPFQAQTPILQTYSEFHFYSQTRRRAPPLLHTDTSSVTCLRTNMIPDFQQYPNLHCLHLFSTMELSHTFLTGHALSAAVLLCPGLQKVIPYAEGDTFDIPDVQREIQARELVITVTDKCDCGCEKSV